MSDRTALPNRMRSATFTLPIDDRKVLGIVNYVTGSEGIVTKAFWVKVKPTDSYLDRELRASGKLVSRLFQRNEPLKEMVDTLSQDNIIGIMINYYMKNQIDILSGRPLEKPIRNISTDPYRIKE